MNPGVSPARGDDFLINLHQEIESNSSTSDDFSEEEKSLVTKGEIVENDKVDLIPQPISNEKLEILEESNILEMPDNTSDDGIGLSDIPIMKVSSDNKTAKKPMGSAYIHTKMSIGKSNKVSDVYVCIDLSLIHI